MPEGLAERIERSVGILKAAYARGQVVLPADQIDKPPLWLAIERAMDEQDARRQRSRRKRRRKGRALASAAPMGVQA